MSTFAGPIEEIPGMSVDCFENENLKSSVYFLSHVHSDHMSGLNQYFIENLSRYNKFLYCSEITKIILISKFNLTNPTNIKDLSLMSPVIIEYKVRRRHTVFVTVTLIPAGHCPGSVMFLFKYKNKKILYTGDFRINSNDLSKIRPLHDCDGIKLYPLKFDKIYLDTTFLNLNYSNIPTRKESVEEIKKAAIHWLQQDFKNVVLLKLPYIYGLEYVFREISIALNKKVHVMETVYNVYRQISEIAPHITDDAQSTPLHACLTMGNYRKSKCLPCRLDVDETNILSIHISVLKWGGKLETNAIAEWDDVEERQLSVCYSSHASCNELKSFLQYFHAKQIYPCVLPKNSNEHDQVYDLLCEFTKRKDDEIVSIVNHELNFPKPSSSKSSFKSEIFSDSTDSD